MNLFLICNVIFLISVWFLFCMYKSIITKELLTFEWQMVEKIHLVVNFISLSLDTKGNWLVICGWGVLENESKFSLIVKQYQVVKWIKSYKMNQIKPSQPSQLKSKWTAVIVIRVCYKNITADRAYIATKKKYQWTKTMV